MKSNKFNKNNIQIFSLLITAIAIMLTMLGTVIGGSFLKNKNDILTPLLAALLVTLTFFVYALLTMKRINPKKYIYISYAGIDKEIAEKISLVLNNQFKTLSKYRFEILTADSVPFGNDMYITMQENLSKSDIAIVIVSSAYLRSDWCLKEFTTICEKNKRIIPIVIDSFRDLADLPKNISNIKALSLIDCKSEKDFADAISKLAKDLIKQRTD